MYVCRYGFHMYVCRYEFVISHFYSSCKTNMYVCVYVCVYGFHMYVCMYVCMDFWSRVFTVNARTVCMYVCMDFWSRLCAVDARTISRSSNQDSYFPIRYYICMYVPIHVCMYNYVFFLFVHGAVVNPGIGRCVCVRMHILHTFAMHARMYVSMYSMFISQGPETHTRYVCMPVRMYVCMYSMFMLVGPNPHATYILGHYVPVGHRHPKIYTQTYMHTHTHFRLGCHVSVGHRHPSICTHIYIHTHISDWVTMSRWAIIREHVYIHTHTHTHTHFRLGDHVLVGHCPRTCIHTYTHTHIHISGWVTMSLWAIISPLLAKRTKDKFLFREYVCMHVCIYVYIYIYTSAYM
jgi:hypothetical protein